MITRAFVVAGAALLPLVAACAALDALEGDTARELADDAADDGHTAASAGGANDAGDDTPTDPTPSGPPLLATEVQVMAGKSCALLLDGQVRCWGDVAPELSHPGPFASFAASDTFACGLRSDGLSVCWGTEPPANLASATSMITAGDASVCGLDADRRVVCSGVSFALPEGPFTSVEVGPGIIDAYLCGHSSGELVCTGAFEPPIPPPEALDPVSTGPGFACGVDDDGAAVCFDHQESWLVARGPFDSVHVGKDRNGCGIRRGDRGLECWADGEHGQEIVDEAPPGRFRTAAVDVHHACAVRDDNVVICWGHSIFGALDVPPG